MSTKSPEALASAIAALLYNHADPFYAPAMEAYMRNKFRFLGIQSPARRTLAKNYVQAVAKTKDQDYILAVASALFDQEYRELHYVATDVLVRCAPMLRPEAEPAMRSFITTNSWWDSVDPLAKVIGTIVISHGVKEIPEEYARHSNMWLRRVALIHQLGFREKTDVEMLSRFILSMAADEDFFIRKAIGWALREYAYTDPVFVQNFVADHATVLSGLSQREATKNIEKILARGKKKRVSARQ